MSEAEIFAAALDRAEGTERIAYLDKACAGNERLRKRVEALLRAHAEPDDVLDPPEPRHGTIDYQPIAEQPGTRIGPYKLMEQIGEGGFGLVFVAEQQEPVKRKVALKIIKPGMDSRQVITRFEAERQALALMEHPNIAKVLDAGATETGRPYFVMELVRGIPITEYCDQNQLAPKERLELFISVCQAIQHAHQKGIIHRDVKPSNVLVTSHDGKPVAKVIDFGVAKAIHQHLTERTLYTNFAQMIGTPLYMSPEQAEMSGLDIDTRSDIYSLGVLLYELLTGTTPLEKKRFREAAYDEIRRLIREEEPPKPSTRLSSSASLASVAAQRKMEPAKLSKFMRGDLDWITMKALEKDRTRRYETANGFARDIQRYLSDEPIEARPPSPGYRLKKYVRRNSRLIVVGGLSAVLALACLFGGLTVGLIRTQRERERAEVAEQAAREERDQARAEAERADTEAATAQAVNQFLLNDLLAQAAPEQNARDKKVTVEELLGQAARRIPGRFESQPLVEAAIRLTIARAYHALGELSSAQPHFERAYELRQAELGDDNESTADALFHLAAIYQDLGQYARAEPLFVKTYEYRRRTCNEEHPDTLNATFRLAAIYDSLGQYSKAEPLYMKAFEISRRTRGEDHSETLDYLNALAMLHEQQGQYDKAESLMNQVLLARRRTMGPDHRHTLRAMHDLATVLLDRGQAEQAEKLLKQTVEGRQRVLGNEHPETLGSLSDLALAYQNQGHLTKAEPIYAQVLEMRRRIIGSEHPHTITSLNNVAYIYQAQGQFKKAEPLFDQSLVLRRKVLGDEHPDTIVAINNAAHIKRALGDLPTAEKMQSEAYAICRRVHGDEHPTTLQFANNLAYMYSAQGKHTLALPLYIKTLDAARRTLRDDHPTTLMFFDNLAAHYQRLGKFDKSEPIYRDVLEITRKRIGQDSVQAADALLNLAADLLKQSRFADAEPMCRESLAIRERKTPDEWPAYAVRRFLGTSLLGQKKYAEAEQVLLESYRGLKKHDAALPSNASLHIVEAVQRLAELYDATGQPDEAAKWRAELPKLRR